MGASSNCIKRLKPSKFTQQWGQYNIAINCCWYVNEIAEQQGNSNISISKQMLLFLLRVFIKITYVLNSIEFRSSNMLLWAIELIFTSSNTQFALHFLDNVRINACERKEVKKRKIPILLFKRTSCIRIQHNLSKQSKKNNYPLFLPLHIVFQPRSAQKCSSISSFKAKFHSANLSQNSVTVRKISALSAASKFHYI